MAGGGAQPAGGGGRGRKLLAIVAAVVAVLLAAGGGVWFLTEDDGGTEAAKGDGKTGRDDHRREHKKRFGVIWEDGPPDMSERQGNETARGTWFFEDMLVRALPESVTAYHVDTGKEIWSLDLVRGDSCAAAPHQSGGRIVVQWGGMCEKIMAIDLARGKELWREDLPAERGETDEFTGTEMAVSGDVAAVSWIGDAIGYDLSTGRVRWRMEDAADCRDDSYIGGKRLVALVTCFSTGRQSIQAVKPDGEKAWEWKVPLGADVRTVFSSDPVVLGLMAGEGSDYTDIVALDDKGRTRSKIRVPEGRFDFLCGASGVAHCDNVLVDEEHDALYLQTMTHQGSGSGMSHNEIAAYDLSTGKAKWLSKPTGEGRQVSPLASYDGRLLAYERISYDKAGLITSVDPDTGEAAPYARLPEAGAEQENELALSDGSTMHWYEGRFFVVANRFSTDESLNKGHVLAFG
ncbi:PQQ-binding-like beta-propeller repeat protein [Streptomyces glaucosporus]|uniref:PQQ-binding-like beta-propeller repeat protein n=2 Tax=Streptomyces glaucosporus TaxID=284044 RepID=A0ABN3HPW3_9ACTN